MRPYCSNNILRKLLTSRAVKKNNYFAYFQESNAKFMRKSAGAGEVTLKTNTLHKTTFINCIFTEFRPKSAQ